MITLLVKLLIRSPDDHESDRVRQAYGTLCGVVGLALNLLLFGGKFIAGFLAGSIAITADAFNNLGDASASIVTLLGIRLASKKPDPHHPFGHGRLEYVSGVAVSLLIILVGIELARDSLQQILHPTPLAADGLTIGILLVSIAMKAYMFVYNRSIGKQIRSPGMEATAIDSLSDVVTTSAVLLSTVVAQQFDINIDGWCGMLVSCFILYSGIKSTKATLSPLLGNPPEAEYVQRIREIVLRHPEISNIHDLIVHDYGPGRRMITLHAEVDEGGDLVALHNVIDRAENELAKQLGCTATIHMDPISADSEKTAAMRSAVTRYAAALDSRIDIHDFRIMENSGRTTVMFDALLPFESAIAPEELHLLLDAFVRSAWDTHAPIITIDRPYHQT